MLGKLSPDIAGDLGAEADLLPRLMACTLPAAIYVKDLRRRYICLNEVECRSLGVAAPQEVIGKTADQLLSAKRSRLWRQEEAIVLVTGEPLIERVERVEEPDGTTRWLSATKVPVRSEAGAVTGLFGITRDITAQKIEERLREQFLGTISHELRTPVTAILGSIALAAGGAVGPLPEPAVRLLQTARRNGERLVHLINDILDLQKVESGMMTFDLKRVDVRPLVEHEIAAISSFAEPYRVSVRLDGGAATGTVLVDARRLAQVISNLLSNAVKFSPAGAEVVVGIERLQHALSISVRDHGPGIPVAFKQRVFDKFVQVNRREAREKGGTGLGLSIVKELVERMKGEVGCAPAPGGGSMFRVTLPICDDDALDPMVPVEPKRNLHVLR